MLASSVALIALQTAVKHQAIAGNFPMRLRWNFHRLMLAQSMGFYQDEFAGRIATKVMQTALAVRDTWIIVTELIVFVVIYFATMLAVFLFGLAAGGWLGGRLADRVASPARLLGWVQIGIGLGAAAASLASRPTPAR